MNKPINTEMEVIAPGGATGRREEWIDCLRGIMMMLVVLMHLDYLTGDASQLSKYGWSFRMPLFFLVSGYFAYSARRQCSMAAVGETVTHRLRMVVYPTLLVFSVMFMLNVFVFHVSLRKMLLTSAMWGYWFPIAGFEMLLICALPLAMLNGGARRRRVAVAWLVTLIPLSVALGDYIFQTHLIIHKYVLLFLVKKVLRYLPFFIVGILLNVYQEPMKRAVERVWYLLPIVAAALLVWGHEEIEVPYGDLADGARMTLPVVVLAVSIFYTCYMCRGVLNRDNFVGRQLAYIGRNTLPVYLFHLLFNRLLSVNVVQTHIINTTVFDADEVLPFTIILTIGLTYACLGLYELLRLSGASRYIFPHTANFPEANKPQPKRVKIVEA